MEGKKLPIFKKGFGKVYQNYNYYQQPQMQKTAATMQPQPQVNQGLFLKGRPVSSLEEVRATGIDFDGSIFYFPDLANKRIYTKQINLDGTATLNMYELKDVPLASSVGNYITREEFEMAMAQIKQTLTSNQSPQKIVEEQQPFEF